MALLPPLPTLYFHAFLCFLQAAALCFFPNLFLRLQKYPKKSLKETVIYRICGIWLATANAVVTLVVVNDPAGAGQGQLTRLLLQLLIAAHVVETATKVYCLSVIKPAAPNIFGAAILTLAVL